MTWKKEPPTEQEIQESYNGFFWIRYCIMEQSIDEDGTWPALYKVEPVQIFWTLSTKRSNDKLVDRAVFHIGTNDYYLDDEEDMKEFTWQSMVPPLDIQKTDC